MNTIQQHHSGSGDNIRDKFYIQIKALAPADLQEQIGKVFESLRKKDRDTAKIQMGMIAGQRDPDTAALLEVISIYGQLIDTSEHERAWGAVSKIAISSKDEVVKDVCLAAMLKLAANTPKSEAAKQHYLAKTGDTPYAKEVFLRAYADEATLEQQSKALMLSEGELTGIVEGALRLEAVDLALRTARRLDAEHPSYNARVLQALATAFDLNRELGQKHLWLASGSVKKRVDRLADLVVSLLDETRGTDERLYDIACPIYELYQGLAPAELLDAGKRYVQHAAIRQPKIAALFKAAMGDDSEIEPLQRDLVAAAKNPQQRSTWCRTFLQVGGGIAEALAFIHLATHSELKQWLDQKPEFKGASEKETALLHLTACAALNANQNDILERAQLATQVDVFFKDWASELDTFAPERIFDIADKLFEAELAHKALALTSLIIPDGELWASPFVLKHLRNLLEVQQLKTFDTLLAKVDDAGTDLPLMNLQSIKFERLGDIASAIKVTDSMIALEPSVVYCWYRACSLRYRFRDAAEQRALHQAVPDALLRDYSAEAASILYFLSVAGDFARAEAHWVQWFVKDPLGVARAIVDFYIALTVGAKIEPIFSADVPPCRLAVRYEQNGSSTLRLIVDDLDTPNEYVLKTNTLLTDLLQNTPVEGEALLGLTKYRVVEHLPPFVACLRIALQIRDGQNDGSDCFAMLKMPNDPAQFMPLLEERLGPGLQRKQQLAKLDNFPLFVRGFAMQSGNPFKCALNCWQDAGVPKSLLFGHGAEAPEFIVLDAYGIAYLAVTDLAQPLVDTGVKLVLPAATRQALDQWVIEISDENFMSWGVTPAGEFFLSTHSDVQTHQGHVLAALKLILEKSSVVHPVLHDVAVEVYSIKHGIDHTVYDAMQLSAANEIPWFCMDGAFATLHNISGHPTANVYALLEKASTARSDPKRKKHGFLLYALGMLPIPIRFKDIEELALSSDHLAEFILFKMIQNHGKYIFLNNDEIYILNIIATSLTTKHFLGKSAKSDQTTNSPWTSYSAHIFNHGLRLFLQSSNVGTTEYRMAVAIKHVVTPNVAKDEVLTHSIMTSFMEFAQGHFMSFAAIREAFQGLAGPVEQDVEPVE